MMPLSWPWCLAGWAFVTIATGTLRLIIGLPFGGPASTDLWDNSGVGLVGSVLLPVNFAILACQMMKRKANAVSAVSEPPQPS